MVWSETSIEIIYIKQQERKDPPLDIPIEVNLDQYINQVLDEVIFGEEKILGKKLPEIKIPLGVWTPGTSYGRLHLRKSFSTSFIPGFTTRKWESVEIKPSPPMMATRGCLNLILDISGSMEGGITFGLKRESMKTASIGLIECAKKRNDLLNVFLFGDASIPIVEMSKDYLGAQRRMASIKQCSSGSTYIYNAATKTLENTERIKKATTMIITDGQIKDLSSSQESLENLSKYGPLIFIVIEDQKGRALVKEILGDKAIVIPIAEITEWQGFAKKMVEIWASPAVQARLERYEAR